jgi:hypothetical protein
VTATTRGAYAFKYGWHYGLMIGRHILPITCSGIRIRLRGMLQ